MYADLHLHSTASDGVYSPGAVVNKAKELGFRAIALTDHDTVAGLEEALCVGERLGVEIIPGVELSAIDAKAGRTLEVHILGYFIDHHQLGLKSVLNKISEDRQVRAAGMVEKLNGLGVKIDLKRVRDLAAGESVGRPHIARAMLEKGFIDDIKEAFSIEYLGRGGRAYVERFKISPQQAIDLIKDAGGLPVLAHPGYLSDGSLLAEEEIEAYQQLGLKGLEVYYSKHSAEQVDYYKRLADRLGLMLTGGSDCHGGSSALIGTVKLPYFYVEVLRNVCG